jgi:hypothetical protein
MTIISTPGRYGKDKLAETEPLGTSRTINGRVWILEQGYYLHRWRAADCMCTIGLSKPEHSDNPYTVFETRYPTFEAATRYAVRKHNAILRDAKRMLDRWPDEIKPTLGE